MSTPPPTVIIGAKGFIGSALWNAYHEADRGCRGTARRPDATDLFHYDLVQAPPQQLDRLDEHIREAVIMAAVSRINACEADPAGTRRINVDGIVNCVTWLWQRGIRPLFISTDYVFDGRDGAYREDDPTNPITEYGRQKRAAEEAVLAITEGRGTVLRLSKIYSAQAGDGSLLDEMTAALARGAVVRAAVDQTFCPLFRDDLIAMIRAIQVAGTTGVLHVCGDEAVSRYQLAQRVAARFGADAALVEPICLDDLPAGPIRPKNTSMCNQRLRAIYRDPLTPMETVIDQLAAAYRRRADEGVSPTERGCHD